MNLFYKPFLAALALLLSYCGNSPAPAFEPQQQEPGLGAVELQRVTGTTAESPLLDIGVIVFTSSSQRNETENFGESVFSEVRDNERHLLPYKLRQALVDSNHWGAVRVLPAADPSVDLLIDGRVLISDGNELELAIRASDSSGRLWLDKSYRDIADETDYPESRDLRRYTPAEMAASTDPFADLYRQIANDLLQQADMLSAGQLREIREISLLSYANDLSPQSFGHMLATDSAGRVSVASLPASNDPMLARVMDMRRRHHLFIDTVDEYYEALHEEMRSPYLIWRRYSFDQDLAEQRALERGADQSKYSSSNGYLTLTQRYDRYRWAKIYEQEYQELAAGFNREAAPAILELNRQVHGLSGTMEEQYGQWRRILRELFLLETGD
jgi:hypothetical protein